MAVIRGMKRSGGDNKCAYHTRKTPCAPGIASCSSTSNGTGTGTIHPPANDEIHCHESVFSLTLQTLLYSERRYTVVRRTVHQVRVPVQVLQVQVQYK